MNFDSQVKMYQALQAIKKESPAGKAWFDGGVLFNQKVLMACGKIDMALKQLSKDERDKFMNEHKRFFEGFAWVYYIDWRTSRAKSCAHLLDLYEMLNVKLTAHDFVGETFYAGIPKVTIDEMNDAIENQWLEKVGIDGRLHPCDEYGYFPDIIDERDIYCDGTMVTLTELHNYRDESEG